MYILCTDDFVRTKISWMQKKQSFLTHDAPLRVRELRYHSGLRAQRIMQDGITVTKNIKRTNKFGATGLKV